MARYKLIPWFQWAGNKPWAIEIEGDRARVWRGDELIHDWGHTDCANYALPPGLGDVSFLSRWLGRGPLIESTTNFLVVLNHRVVEFGMSEEAFAALTRFWERGYLIRNPDIPERWWWAGLWWVLAGSGIAGLLTTVTVLAFLYTLRPGAFLVGSFPLRLAVGPPGLTAWGQMRQYRYWTSLREQLEAEGIRLDRGDSTYAPAEIDIMTGRVRVE